MADVSWVPGAHQLPPRPSTTSSSIPMQPERHIPHHMQRSIRERVVPPLPLHMLSEAQASPGVSSSRLEDLSSFEASTRAFLDSVAPPQPRMARGPPAPSPRVAAWKARLQKRMAGSGMEWDSFTSSPRAKLSTNRSYDRSDSKRKICRTMAPAMFAATEAREIENLLNRETDGYLDTFKKPIPPSRSVPSVFPGYRLHKRIQGTWAYQPPDTRQEALNEWFIRRMKRPAPSIEKVHVAFGKTTYPYVFNTRKKRGPEVPEPVPEPPKMTLAPRKSSARPPPES